MSSALRSPQARRRARLTPFARAGLIVISMFARLTAAEHLATPSRSGRIVADGLNRLWRWQDVSVRRPSGYVETEYGSCIVYDLTGDEEADAFIRSRRRCPGCSPSTAAWPRT